MTVEQVNPADYVLPDGSIDVTADNWPTPSEMARVREAGWIRHCLELLREGEANA